MENAQNAANVFSPDESVMGISLTGRSYHRMTMLQSRLQRQNSGNFRYQHARTKRKRTCLSLVPLKPGAILQMSTRKTFLGRSGLYQA